MAGIDKLYGTLEEAIELGRWAYWYKESIIPYLESLIAQDDNNHLIIARFPKEVDYDLIKTCPIPWVVERIKAQYAPGRFD